MAEQKLWLIIYNTIFYFHIYYAFSPKWRTAELLFVFHLHLRDHVIDDPDGVL